MIILAFLQNRPAHSKNAIFMNYMSHKNLKFLLLFTILYGLCRLIDQFIFIAHLKIGRQY